METIHSRFTDNLERTIQISELNKLIIDFAKNALRSLGKIQNPRTGANAAQNQIDSFDRLSSSPRIKELLPIVYGQQVVLFVSSFEAYLKELVRFIGNNYIGLIKWPEGSSGKVDLASLSKSNLTIGDLILAILEQHDISFQDLQATKRFFKNYMDLEVGLGIEYENNLILAAAIRHTVIHSGGIIDTKFIKQIRSLDKATKDLYKEGDSIEISEDTVIELRDSFINFSKNLQNVLSNEVEELQKEV
jgi:hypothetical protein